MIKKLQTFWNNNFTTIKQILTIVVCSFIAALVYPLLMIGQQIDKGTELYVLSPGMWGFFNLITETFYTKILHYTKEKINSLNYAIFTTTGFVILNIPILIFIFFKTNKNFFIYTCFIIFLNTIWSWIFWCGEDLFQNLNTKINTNDKSLIFIKILVGGIIWGIVYGLMLKNGGTAGDLDTIIIHKTLTHRYGFDFFLKCYYISTELLWFLIYQFYFEKTGQLMIINSIVVSFIAGSVMGQIFRYFSKKNTNDKSNKIYNCNFLYKNITLIVSMFFVLQIILQLDKNS